MLPLFSWKAMKVIFFFNIKQPFCHEKKCQKCCMRQRKYSDWTEITWNPKLVALNIHWKKNLPEMNFIIFYNMFSKKKEKTRKQLPRSEKGNWPASPTSSSSTCFLICEISSPNLLSIRTNHRDDDSKKTTTHFYKKRKKCFPAELCIGDKGHFCHVSVCKVVWMSSLPPPFIPSNQTVSPMCSANHKKGFFFFFFIPVVNNLWPSLPLSLNSDVV